MNHRKQLSLFAILLFINALMPFLTYTFIPIEEITMGQPVNPAVAGYPGWVLGLMNAAIILVAYGLLGLIGYFLARRLGLPGIYREGAGRRSLVINPMLVGLALGVVITVGNWLFSLALNWEGSIHPSFPLSIFASVSAGIGEELIFRLFLMSLWAFVFNLILRRWNGRTAALWIGNIIAALAFAAGHLPTLLILTGASSPAELPVLALVEVVLLNGAIGIIAGRAFIKDGFVAAAGIHFWADVAWHIVLPLVLV